MRHRGGWLRPIAATPPLVLDDPDTPNALPCPHTVPVPPPCLARTPPAGRSENVPPASDTPPARPGVQRQSPSDASPRNTGQRPRLRDVVPLAWTLAGRSW